MADTEKPCYGYAQSHVQPDGDEAYYLQNGIYSFGGRLRERGHVSLKGKAIEHVDNIEKNR